MDDQMRDKFSAEKTFDRGNVTPIAWAVRRGGRLVSVAFSEADAICGQCEGDSVVPLYGQPTLTDAEREAVETAAQEADAHQHARRAATLRGLLERLK